MIPCKRPKVDVETVRTYPAGSLGEGYAAPLSTWIQATCRVPRCDWTYSNVVKSDVQEQAVRHRSAHRAAVPKTHIGGSAAHGFHGSCFDENGWAHWGTRPGCVTRTDVEAAVAHHLSAEHGLAVCP